jgi:tetraacyldisaccharide 4'-kinase
MQKVPSGLAPALFIPGLMYEGLIRARNRLHSSGWLRRQSLPGPVISVGNITMGGTGKTPLVLFIAHALEALGFQPAILSRGYGRIEPQKCHLIAPGDVVLSPAETLGDEPALIRRRIPTAYFGIAPNRFQAGDRLAKRMLSPVFVLDDGFQHRRLARDLDIVLLDSSQPLRSNRVFPRGTLREPLSGLHRCPVLMINDSGNGKSPESMITEVRQYAPKAAVFTCRQGIQSLVPYPAWAGGVGENAVPDGPVYLATAIGNPERFEWSIRELGIRTCGTKFFRDHYRLKQKDWAECVHDAKRKGAGAIVVTEKDAIKISSAPAFPLLVAVQSTAVSDPREFELVLKRCLEEWS